MKSRDTGILRSKMRYYYLLVSGKEIINSNNISPYL